ncbi:MAG: sugar ABC transporter permease [Clostridiaceae bacterium]|nr:sugar ABC transporter permease [Clostridiaceae bacterium]
MIFKRKELRMQTKEQIAGYLFILPTYILFILFSLIPTIGTFVVSFTEYNMVKPLSFVGLENYKNIFSDSVIPVVTLNTIKYTVFSVVLNVVFALILAIALNSKIILAPVRNIARATVFFPYIIAYAYISLIWIYMFSTDTGIINYYLNLVGIDSVPWFTSHKYALNMLIVLDVWKNVGFGMVIFLSGLQNIPKEYYEAASIDGASRIKTVFGITLPLLTPMIVMNTMLYTINALQVFDSINVITKGGPGDSTRSIVTYLYDTAFKGYKMGYASALSIIFMLAVVVITLMQFRLDKGSNYN